ncbi:hypothetical protein OBBRIDRAFT_891024 [Obba rivulosa]|uniref:Uncharacterized protein n=1 Tax=Obba rivulosa TaxID=1052685 RepID=A0A8E2AUP4_9APHY|nr:hypothetical protein OBBRIDRAFT_891024 [Obba rivulosa]
MGRKARKRFAEVDRVMRIMHGGRYVWNWKRFKVAMRNMGWGVKDVDAKTFKIERKAGLWTVVEGLSKRPAPFDRPSAEARHPLLIANKSVPDVAVTAKSPIWLYNAAHALGEFVDNHQELLMVVEAILILAGHVPAFAGILGVDGAILAGPAAQLVGTILVGMGQRSYDKGAKDDS